MGIKSVVIQSQPIIRDGKQENIRDEWEDIQGKGERYRG